MPAQRRHPSAGVEFQDWLIPEMRIFLLTPAADEKQEHLRGIMRIRRRRAIAASATALVVSLMCFASYIGRPSRLVLVISSAQTLLAVVGLFGALKVQGWQIAAHVVMMGGLSAAYVLTLVAQALFVDDGGNGPLPSWVIPAVLIAFSCCLLGCLVFNVLLGISILELQEAEETSDEGESSDELDDEELARQARQMDDSEACCVCMDTPKNAVLTPCGHRAVCIDCGNRLLARSIRCPICRQHISAVVRVYDS